MDVGWMFNKSDVSGAQAPTASEKRLESGQHAAFVQ